MLEGHVGDIVDKNRNKPHRQENRGGNPRRDVIPLNSSQGEDRQIQPPQGNIPVIHTIHGGPIMLGNTHNSHKRYSIKASDAHYPVYTSMHERPIFSITFEGRETLPLYNDPLLITVKVTHCEMHRVLVDNDSSLDLLYLSVLLDTRILQGDYPTINASG